MDLKTPQTGTELFAYYRYLLPRMDHQGCIVIRNGLKMMLDEHARLVEVEKAYEELKANRAMGRPLGRPPKDAKDE
jgi:hypothetical protein